MSNTAWETLSNQAVATAGIVYFLALVVYLAEWASLRQPAADRELVGVGGGAEPAASAAAPAAGAPAARTAFLGRLGILLTALACAAHFVALVGRGMAADPNRVPWGNMYEFTLSGTFVVALLYVVLYKKFALGWMGPLVVGFVVATLMVAVIWLYDAVAPLTEALNSPWLVIHVISAVIATGAFTLGGIASVMYLVRMRAERRAAAAERPLSRWLDRVPQLDALDRLAYRVHAFAFPVWTFAVLITGPIWAHEAWSRYWNWDPKEVWAFITWVVYAGYLHARATAGWKGRKAALLALVGVATLWFNFIGINYFSTTSQHAYAAERIVP
ncbi:c-type cytochrome biogenesis protein CcsB [Nocardioides daeguensis]|uniref:Cytochrome c assembly protein domain-containing protein n=1 Tax=Nocardioides daeguensis TaxID=908359 RepID=A0ABP6UYZ2_9ACTN|nr:c-type cytochrome biogenesis protein CcsB [Nocardioides daeguensis]MBV6726984.1 c-type cytochrome biogenesis protein CcsB [Nocardioides daeguensis]MCR1771613.1 c-type cytochrome biogenesis protein CcsB [Nocardioides daeguensis]